MYRIKLIDKVNKISRQILIININNTFSQSLSKKYKENILRNLNSKYLIYWIAYESL